LLLNLNFFKGIKPDKSKPEKNNGKRERKKADTECPGKRN
jgi:hypothetical protein